MKKTIFFLLLLMIQTVVGQQNKGAIKTQSGFLVYDNFGVNSYTLHLMGDVDISNFPFIRQNANWFQFQTVNKSKFGTDAKQILLNYMKWEKTYVEKQFGATSQLYSQIFTNKALRSNFWKYTNPSIKNKQITKPTKATYFLDFMYQDTLYRLSYASASGNDGEAKALLLEIANNFRFYDNGINLQQLQQSILQGKDL